MSIYNIELWLYAIGMRAPTARAKVVKKNREIFLHWFRKYDNLVNCTLGTYENFNNGYI